MGTSHFLGFLPHNLLQLGDLPQQVEEFLLSIGGHHPLVVGAKGLTVGLDGGHGGVREQDIGPLLPVAVVGPADQALVLEGAGDGGDLGHGQVQLPDDVLEVNLLAAGVLGMLGEQPDQGIFIRGIFLEQVPQRRAVEELVRLLRGEGA